MKFNTVLLLCFSIFLMANATAQVGTGKHRIEVISVCTSLKDTAEKWSDWSEKTKVDLTIKIDYTNQKIVFVSDEEDDEEYDMERYTHKEAENGESETTRFICTNHKGKKCTLRYVVYTERSKSKFYVEYAKKKYMYTCRAE